MTKDVVYKFFLSDVDDPAIYAGEYIYKWEKSEAGKWVMQHSKEHPTWYITPDYNMYGYTVSIVAELSPELWTFFYLKFSSNKLN